MTRDELDAIERCTAQVIQVQDRIDRMLLRNESVRVADFRDISGTGVPEALQPTLVYGGALRQRVDSAFARKPGLFTVDPDDVTEDPDDGKRSDDADISSCVDCRPSFPTAAELLHAALRLLWVALLVLAVWLGWSRYAAVARDAHSASTANDASPAPTPAPHPGSP